MPTLAEIVDSLSPEEQQAVLAFVEYLRNGPSTDLPPEPRSRVVAAAEDFIRQHPELLSRLAR